MADRHHTASADWPARSAEQPAPVHAPSPEWAGPYSGEMLSIAGRAFPLNSTSIAYENLRVVKSGDGTVFGFSGYSSKVSAQWIQLFDSVVLPTTGSIPVVILTVATVANFTMSFSSVGRRFRQGIIIANSTTGPTYTAGAADTWFDVQYA